MQRNSLICHVYSKLLVGSIFSGSIFSCRVHILRYNIYIYICLKICCSTISQGTQDQDQKESSFNDEQPYEVMFRASMNNACTINTSELKSHVQNKMLTKQTKATPESLRPNEFAEQYGEALPIQVRIVESSQTVGGAGFYVDEIYNVHLVTATDGVSMTDGKGLLVLVSTHSSTQFGVIFNPQADLDKAVKGYMFESVEDVVGCVQLPRVLCATKAYKSHSPASSVEAGEVLIVNNAEIPPQSNAAVLTTFSIDEQVTKKLQAECKGHFVTDPSCIKLHLSTILQHLSTLFPTCAVMYPGHGRDAISDPAIVTLLRYHPKSVLVATTVHSPMHDCNPYQPVEIPLDAAVKMVAMPNTVTMSTGSSQTAPHYEMKSEKDVATFPPLGTREIQPPIVPRRSKVCKNNVTPTVAPRTADHVLVTALVGQSRDARQLQQCNTELRIVSNVEAHDFSVATKQCKTDAQKLVPNQGEELSGNEGYFLQQGVETTPSDKFEMLSCNVAELVKRFAVLTTKIVSMERRLEAIHDLVRMRDNKSRELGGSEQRKFLESLTLHQVNGILRQVELS